MWKICCGEPWNLANLPAEFEKICRGKLCSLIIVSKMSFVAIYIRYLYWHMLRNCFLHAFMLSYSRNDVSKVSPSVTWRKPRLRLHSHWHEYQLRVIHTSNRRRSGAFTVTRTSKRVNSDAIKNFVKIVTYLEFLAKVYSSIAGNFVCKRLRQNYVISLLCAV